MNKNKFFIVLATGVIFTACSLSNLKPVSVNKIATEKSKSKKTLSEKKKLEKNVLYFKHNVA